MVEGMVPSTNFLKEILVKAKATTAMKGGKKPKGHRDGKFTRW